MVHATYVQVTMVLGSDRGRRGAGDDDVSALLMQQGGQQSTIASQVPRYSNLRSLRGKRDRAWEEGESFMRRREGREEGVIRDAAFCLGGREVDHVWQGTGRGSSGMQRAASVAGGSTTLAERGHNSNRLSRR